MREVWRTALAALDDAFDGAPPLEELALFRAASSRSISVVRQMTRSRLNSPLAHGVGRYFDAFAAIVFGRATVRYEGQLAMAFEQVANREERNHYSFVIDDSRMPWQLDLRPAVREAVADVLGDIAAQRISAKFHRTLVLASANLLDSAMKHYGMLPVVLSGGCFQNVLLTEGLLREARDRFPVYLHQEVPANDGGLSLGQAIVADAIARDQG
jgi:hydrogenase maturation protein HypF